jgi:hypothetical protein
LSELDAPLPDPDAGRHAEGLLERATEVTDADVERRRQVFDDDLAGEIGIDMRREPPRLPRCKSSARDLSWASVAVLTRNPWSRISVQYRYGTGDMCSGTLAVTLHRATRSLDELSGHYR